MKIPQAFAAHVNRVRGKRVTREEILRAWGAHLFYEMRARNVEWLASRGWSDDEIDLAVRWRP